MGLASKVNYFDKKVFFSNDLERLENLQGRVFCPTVDMKKKSSFLLMLIPSFLLLHSEQLTLNFTQTNSKNVLVVNPIKCNGRLDLKKLVDLHVRYLYRYLYRSICEVFSPNPGFLNACN